MHGENEEKGCEISVFVLTYNHSRTVRRTLDGILAQETECSYEVIIGDDGSDDGTTEILSEYKKRSPDKIRLFIEPYNTGYPTKLVYKVLSRYARGKYIATVEGDDWWIDKKKLQKQWEFMESHKDFSAVFSDVLVHDENDDVIEDFLPYVKKRDCIITLDDFRHMECPGMMCTCFMRNFYKTGDSPGVLYKADPMMGDVAIYAVLLTYGRIYQMSEKTAVYRYVKKPGGSNYNSAILGNRYLLLKQLRYCIRIENFLIDKTKGRYRAEMIDEQIRAAAKRYNWTDLWIAIRETKLIYRYALALWYHSGAVNGRFYKANALNLIDFNNRWKSFMRDKNKIVLFGAGALAEEFLDLYSWKKQVMFLVDNDEAKVGRSYKGYMIKKPEEILHFRNNVTVLVTNEKHETEICGQLKQMGIRDYCCYYSMQSRRLRNRITGWFDKGMVK